MAVENYKKISEMTGSAIISDNNLIPFVKPGDSNNYIITYRELADEILNDAGVYKVINYYVNPNIIYIDIKAKSNTVWDGSERYPYYRIKDAIEYIKDKPEYFILKIEPGDYHENLTDLPDDQVVYSESEVPSGLVITSNTPAIDLNVKGFTVYGSLGVKIEYGIDITSSTSFARKNLYNFRFINTTFDLLYVDGLTFSQVNDMLSFQGISGVNPKISIIKDIRTDFLSYRFTKEPDPYKVLIFDNIKTNVEVFLSGSQYTLISDGPNTFTNPTGYRGAFISNCDFLDFQALLINCNINNCKFFTNAQFQSPTPSTSYPNRLTMSDTLFYKFITINDSLPYSEITGANVVFIERQFNPEFLSKYNDLTYKAPIIPKEYIDPSLNFSSKTTRYVFGADSPLYTVIDLGVFKNLITINAYNEGGPRIYEHNILFLNSSPDTRTLEYIRIIPPDGSPIPPNNTFTISVSPNERRILRTSAFGGYVTASQITV